MISHKLGVLIFLVALLTGAPAWAIPLNFTWEAPTQNTDGSPYTDQGGFKFYRGTKSGVYGAPVKLGLTTTYIVNVSTPGTYFYAVTAFDSSGNESAYSNEVSFSVDSVAPKAPVLASP